MVSPFVGRQRVQSLELLRFQGRDQRHERGPAPSFGVELRLVLERGPAAPELVEKLHPPELVQRIVVECHAVRLATEPPRRIGAATDALAEKPY
jgi:hypothetical protein